MAAGFALLSAPAAGDPPDEDEPPEECGWNECYSDGFVPPPSAALDGLVPDSALGEQAPVGVTCDFATSQRRTADPTDGGNQLVLVYLLPQNTNTGDLKWDLPKTCSDGSIKAGVIQTSYRNVAKWMATNTNVATYPASQKVRRYDPAGHTYTNGSNSATLAEVVFVESPSSVNTWNCRSPNTKLDKVKERLELEGLDDPNYVYHAILHAKQTCTELGVAGRAFRGGNYSYSLTHWYDGSTSYYRAAVSCANKFGDIVWAHEVTHNLGAVDDSAPNSDGNGHVTVTDDLMYSGPAFTADSLITETGAIEMKYDVGLDDYRTTTVLTNRSWDTDGSNYLGIGYRTC